MTRRVPPDLEAATRLRLERLLAPSVDDGDSAGARRGGESAQVVPPNAYAAGPSAPVLRLPSALRSSLLVLERPAVAGLALLGVIAVAAAMLVWHQGRPRAVAVAPLPLATGVVTGPRAAAARASASATAVVVDVTGLVRRPGVVSLPAGSRVVDALAAAGGPRPPADLSAVNLARHVTDGEQIVIRATGAPMPAGVDSTGAGAAGAGSGSVLGSNGSNGQAGPLDLNTASVASLDELPGVGPVLAQRIIDWRTAHGRFTTVDELHEVTGIGSSRFDDLKSLVTV